MTDSAPMILPPARRWAWIRLGVGFAAAVGVAVAIGVPSALLDNPFFVRMTPVPWWSYAAWAVTSVLSGVLAATTSTRARFSSPRGIRPSAMRCATWRLSIPKNTARNDMLTPSARNSISAVTVRLGSANTLLHDFPQDRRGQAQ